MVRKTIRKRFYKKTRWSSNIQEINDVAIYASAGAFSGSTTLATNPVQNSTGVTQTYTVKNFDVTFTLDAEYGTQHLEAITAYIMFVPQGMNVGQDYNTQHPEYILNYKYLGSPGLDVANAVNNQYQPIRVRSRLSRKLNTGDSIILFIKGFNNDHEQNDYQIKLSGLLRWWTKAN